ncbi:MAG: transporter substrate-binding domain-containing protein [Alphaproteobacteria bacterium]|nr:transporter substrate-binding domain-containing protein [Rhodospirillales bacterium]MCW9045621.1 transporter substrate-binding domain-containing protein [Alphaproteobacteria bacterium]
MKNFILLSTLTLSLMFSQQVKADEITTMIFATVNNSSPRVVVHNGQLDNSRPGWFVEVTQKAATHCNAAVEFSFVPWASALKMVELGRVSAAFNSSYNKDRVVYGAYPMANGKPDQSKASKLYSYYAYIPKNKPNRTELQLKNLDVVVERKSSIIPKLKKLGANVFEVDSYLSMLRMLASGRIDAAIGIDHNFDLIISKHPDLVAKIFKIPTPIKKNIGYVMFSKKFQVMHKDLVQCFWDKSAELRKTDWFLKMQASYINAETR